jgi:hypothetical protein
LTNSFSPLACLPFRSGYLLSTIRPDACEQMMGADLTVGGTTTSTDTFSRFLWVKDQRAKSAQNLSGKTNLSAVGYVYTLWIQTYDGAVLVRNTTNETLGGPIAVVFFDLPAGVTLANGDAAGSQQGSYVTAPLIKALRPGQFALVGVALRNPSGQEIHVTPVAYSGKL